MIKTKKLIIFFTFIFILTLIPIKNRVFASPGLLLCFSGGPFGALACASLQTVATVLFSSTSVALGTNALIDTKYFKKARREERDDKQTIVISPPRPTNSKVGWYLKGNFIVHYIQNNNNVRDESRYFSPGPGGVGFNIYINDTLDFTEWGVNKVFKTKDDCDKFYQIILLGVKNWIADKSGHISFVANCVFTGN